MISLADNHTVQQRQEIILTLAMIGAFIAAIVAGVIKFNF